jgi:hypothetical protein
MLNQSGEEPVECPLCMEPLEVDDLTFFPCTCGYQVRTVCVCARAHACMYKYCVKLVSFDHWIATNI